MSNSLRFHHIAMKFVELDSAITFFIEKLDFNMITDMRTETGKRIVWLETADLRLELFESFTKIGRGDHLKHLSFEVADIGQALEELISRGVELAEGPIQGIDEKGGVFSFAFLTGPESLKLELHMMHRKDCTPPNESLGQ